ncbi:MAG: ABC transporter permease [Catenisphaera adipataccumulans]|jgi:ABC-2 type transport system permease protein|uniref:ABC transporter permease n=1 Tax=Catenisphaera adipataccumulans TaxID=700500 RepID=UPI003D933E62
MTVFRAYLRILKKRKWPVLMMSAGLVLFSLLSFGTDSGTGYYKASKPNVVIYDHDDSKISAGLCAYLKKKCDVKKIPADQIDDALFYEDAEYVLTIPKGYGKALTEGDEPELKIRTSNESSSLLAKQYTHEYLRTVKVYLSAGNDAETAVKETASSLDRAASVKMERKKKVNMTELGKATQFFNFENYILLCANIYIIGLILFSFREEKLERRTRISSMNFHRYNRDLLLSNLVVSLGIWAVYTLMAVLFYPQTMATDHGRLFMMNSFLFNLCAMSIGFFVSAISKSKNTVTALMNVIALGLSFLCGAFVPMSMLPAGVLKAAHFLPSYWFVNNNDLIQELDVITGKALQPIGQGGLILILFAAVFFGLSLFFTAKKRKA